MNNISLELKYTSIHLEDIKKYQEKVKKIHKELHNKVNNKDEFGGWLTYPNNIKKEEIERIKIVSKKIQESSDYLIVIGIGGSYLGAKAIIEALSVQNPLTKVLYK